MGAYRPADHSTIFHQLQQGHREQIKATDLLQLILTLLADVILARLLHVVLQPLLSFGYEKRVKSIFDHPGLEMRPSLFDLVSIKRRVIPCLHDLAECIGMGNLGDFDMNRDQSFRLSGQHLREQLVLQDLRNRLLLEIFEALRSG